MPGSSISTNAVLFASLLLITAGGAAAQTQAYTFKRNVSPIDRQAGGRVVVRSVSTGTIETTLTLTGLTPGKAYVAHYHALGPERNADPCASNGPVTVGFPEFKASSAGQATVRLRTEAAKVAGNAGAYINVHAADDLKVVPLCAVIRGRNVAVTAPTTEAPKATEKSADVVIIDNLFQPATLRVKTGTTVIWKHEGIAVHNVLSLKTTALRSSDLGKGETYRYTFDKPGTYEYYCSYHEGMTGTITVTD